MLVTPGRLLSAKVDATRVERSVFSQFMILLSLPLDYSPIWWARQESNLHCFACNSCSIAWRKKEALREWREVCLHSFVDCCLSIRLLPHLEREAGFEPT